MSKGEVTSELGSDREKRRIGAGPARGRQRAARDDQGRWAWQETAPRPPRQLHGCAQPSPLCGTSPRLAHSCTPRVHPTPAPRERAGSSVGTFHFSGSRLREKEFLQEAFYHGDRAGQ